MTAAGLLEIAAAPDPVVLLYHRVCEDDEWTPSEFVVTTSVFRRQMRYLATHGFRTPRLSTVLGGAPGGRAAGARSAVLTFDDGYADTFENALPILAEFGFTAAVFPVLDMERRSNWWDSTESLRAPLLTPAQLRELESAGVELGSHTLTHPRLTRASDADLALELARSREILASLVARPLPVIAYPYGEVNERVKRAAHAAGYEAGLAVASGPLELRADPYEIRRECIVNVASDSYMTLKLSQANLLYAWSKWKVRSGVERIRSWMPEQRAAGER